MRPPKRLARAIRRFFPRIARPEPRRRSARALLVEGLEDRTVMTAAAFGPEWVDVLAGDFNGDGRTDLVARNSQTGVLSVARSNGDGFMFESWGSWSPVSWLEPRVGDFNPKFRGQL